MINKFLQKTLEQNYRLDMLLKKAASTVDSLEELADDGDRVWHCITDEMTFFLNELKVQNLTFNVPTDADFVARRLILAPRINYVQLEGQSDTPSDSAGIFRPVSLSYDCFDASDLVDRFLLDFQVEISESYKTNEGKEVIRQFQDQPIPAKLTYSHNDERYGSPSGLHFDVDWNIKRGSVVQCRASIISCKNEQSDPTTTFKLIGVLEGFKKVRAFK